MSYQQFTETLKKDPAFQQELTSAVKQTIVSVAQKRNINITEADLQPNKANSLGASDCVSVGGSFIVCSA